MNNSRYLLIYLILVISQIIINSLLGISQHLLISLLPMLILCLPVKTGYLAAMFIAFATGLAVDFFSNGLLGMTSFALVPAALCRPLIISLVFGSEVFSRGENITLRRQGVPKFALAILLINAVFFLLYIPLDSAGTRTLGFNILSFVISLLSSSILSLLLVNRTTSE